MAPQNTQNGSESMPRNLFIHNSMDIQQNYPNLSSGGSELSEEEKKHLENAIEWLTEQLKRGLRPSIFARPIVRLWDIAEEPVEGLRLKAYEKESLQLSAQFWLQNELVDDRESPRIQGETLTQEENVERSSARLKYLFDNNFQELISYWRGQEKTKKHIFYDKGVIRDNHNLRFDYFKTCLTKLRGSLLELLRHNLVEQMPSRTTVDSKKYKTTGFKYRTGENWLIKSLDSPIEELLQGQPVLPNNQVWWPGDSELLVEPQSSLKNVFTKGVKTSAFKDRLNVKGEDSTRQSQTFGGQPASHHHIISRDLLLKLLIRINELSFNISSYPQIDNRFENVIEHNYRKYHIVNFWKTLTFGMNPKDFKGEKPPLSYPEGGKVLLGKDYTQFYGNAIMWVEGNIFQGPSPQLRGPFDPGTWTDQSFEADAKPILGMVRYTEFRKFRDSIQEFLDQGLPTPEETDEIQKQWLDVFGSYRSCKTNEDQWIIRRPTTSELERVKTAKERRLYENNEQEYWAIRSEEEKNELSPSLGEASTSTS